MFITRLYPYKQIISMGSQDEYGPIDEIVEETHILNPITQYGKKRLNTVNSLLNIAGIIKLKCIGFVYSICMVRSRLPIG